MPKEIDSGWNHFWFQRVATKAVSPARACLAGFTFVWFLSFLAELPVWFGENGILTSSLGGKLVAFDEYARWQVWSPLWWTDNYVIYYGWILLGALVSLCVILGVGSRLAVGLLLFLVIGWCNRLTWLSGMVEPALGAMLAYLLLEPGKPYWNPFLKSAETQDTWRANAVLRMLMVHVWILLAATLLNQLADLVWWGGEAAWWLASADSSQLFTVEFLRDRAELVNGITHLIIGVEFAALGFLLTRSYLRVGVALGVVASLGIGLIGGQFLYALLLIAAMSAFIAKRNSQRTMLGRGMQQESA